MTKAIQIEGLSKRYRLGLIGGTTVRDDVSRLWARLRGKPDPLLPVGADARHSGNTDDTGDASDDEKFIWALRDIHLDFDEGRAVGIVGRNGAGKTTLLKILSRITAPTSGRAVIRGRVASLLEVGTGFHPELTGRENVFLNGAILGMTKAEVRRKLDEIVEFSGVSQFIETPVKRYSSGMRVRLAFAVAAHLDPEILLIDEVLSVGDAGFQRKCLGKMEEVTRTGRTVLFVSHQLAMVRAFCERTVLLSDGRVAADGDTDDVLIKYLEETGASVEDQMVSVRQAHREGGNGALRLLDWRIHDEELGAGTRALCNGPCEFRIRYESGSQQAELRDVSVAVTINDSFGRPLTTGWTRLTGSDFGSVPASGTFRLRLGSLPLAPGTYRVHLWSSVGREVADLLPNAGSFEVVTTDVFGTGRLPNSQRHGEWIVEDQSWTVEPTS